MTTGGVRTTNHAYGVRHEFDVVHGKEEALSTAEDLVYSRIAESAGHQSHPNLSFEAATIIALICVHRPIAVHELLYKIGVLFPYWGVKVAAALVHRRDAGYYDQTPSEQLKDTLCQYDLPFKVWREDPSGTIFCDVTSTDEAMCVLRKLLPPRALEYQFKALLRRQRVHPRVDTIDPPQVAITKQLTHQGYSVLVDGATGRATIIPVLPLSAASSARTAPTYLLRLPAEMRNEIYKLVLQYAKSGIRIADSKEDTNGPKKKYVFTQTRDIKSDARTSSWGYRSEDFAFSQHQSPLLRSYPLETAIALLLVNKQIRNEAGPIFYGANRFHFDNLYEFVGFTKTLNMKNFGKNFQQVALNYENHFDKYQGYNNIKKYKGFHRLSSDLLGQFRNLKTFALEGDCDMVVRHFRTVLQVREEYRERREREESKPIEKLALTYRGQEICLASDCRPGCEKRHG